LPQRKIIADGAVTLKTTVTGSTGKYTMKHVSTLSLFFVLAS